jgi:hypothetical protein
VIRTLIRVPLRFGFRSRDGYLPKWHHRDEIAASLPQSGSSRQNVERFQPLRGRMRLSIVQEQ